MFFHTRVCSHWILSRTNRLSIHTYLAITSKIKGLFSPVVPRCVRDACLGSLKPYQFPTSSLWEILRDHPYDISVFPSGFLMSHIVKPRSKITVQVVVLGGLTNGNALVLRTKSICLETSSIPWMRTTCGTSHADGWVKRTTFITPTASP